MKQLKALEILKRICNHGSATVIEIKESIAELEALENRSCENCKSFQFWSESKDISIWDSHWVDLGLCYNGVQSGEIFKIDSYQKGQYPFKTKNNYSYKQNGRYNDNKTEHTKNF